MINHKQKIRLLGITAVVVILAVAIALILYALKQNINLFYTPTEVMQANIQADQVIRIGGYVKAHSVQFNNTGESVDFIVTDRTKDIKVKFNGLLPNLFREGQVVVVTGKMIDQQVFVASQVLAKHDEKYMPKPLAKKLGIAS